MAEISLFPLPNAPCIFTGTFIDGEPPIYLGLFVDDFIYFSASSKVKDSFEKQFAKHFEVDFQGEVKYFLGINFTTVRHKDDNHLTVHMDQKCDALDLIIRAQQLNDPATASKPTPYQSGHPVDSVSDIDLPAHECQALNKSLQEDVGSLNWLRCQT